MAQEDMEKLTELEPSQQFYMLVSQIDNQNLGPLSVLEEQQKHMTGRANPSLKDAAMVV